MIATIIILALLGIWFVINLVKIVDRLRHGTCPGGCGQSGSGALCGNCSACGAGCSKTNRTENVSETEEPK